MTHASKQPRLPNRQSSMLVGRDRELDILDRRLAEMLAGHGNLVLVGGEAGIGKTTLVASFANVASKDDALVLTGQCYDLAATPPFGPWVEMIGSYPHRDGPAGPAPERVFDRELTGITSQAALFRRVLAFIVAACEAQPLVLVLEDLHWADDASLDLLRYVARGINDQRILLIATYRNDEITRRHPLFQILPVLVREADAERLQVKRFVHDDLEQLVDVRYDLADADRSALVAFLQRMSEGNPLYATELLRSLEEDQRLQREGDHWKLASLDRTQIPSLVQQVIETRLARLDHETQRLLEVAAVIGQDVPLNLWSAVSEASDADLADAIEHAVAAGLLIENDGGMSLRFTHALIREAIHERQMLLRRRPWHQRVAGALIATQHADPDAIVYHLEQANDPRLVDWLIRSGERAQQRLAWPMAARQFDRAQSLLSNDPERSAERAWLLFRIAVLVRNADQSRSLAHLDEAEQIAVTLGDPVLAHLARAHKGLVLCYGRDLRQGLIDLEAGVLALEGLDEDNRWRLRSVTADLEVILGVQGRATLAQWLANAGRFQQARVLLRDWSDAERDASADAHRAAGVIASNLGEPELARRWFRRSRAVYEARNDRTQAGDDTYHELLDFQLPYAADQLEDRRQLSRTLLGFWTNSADDAQSKWARQSIEAIECVISGEWSRAIELFGQQGEHSNFLISPFLHWRLQLARHRGETGNAWETIRRALPNGSATEPGEREHAVLASMYRVAVELALDAPDLPLSRAWLEAYDRLLAWSGAIRGRAENHLAWARYHHLAGDAASARAHAEAALDRASHPHQPLALIAANRFLGVLASDDGRTADAERHLSDALRLADACAAPFERALTLLAQAELRAVTGDVDDARRLLEATCAICEPLHAQPTLARVARLEEQLAQRQQAGDLPAGLSQREAEVLRLVATGLTDAEVAERLFIARRTVNTHLTAIYTKLGVNSRVAATRFAVEHGLA